MEVREARGAGDIKEGATVEETAKALAAKTIGTSNLEPYLLVKELVSLFLQRETSTSTFEAALLSLQSR